MVLHAGLAALLSRLGARRSADQVRGQPGAGKRRSTGWSGFVDTLVLRTNVSGDPSFAELLRQVRDADLGAFATRDLPFQKVVEQLTRGSARSAVTRCSRSCSSCRTMPAQPSASRESRWSESPA